jgi:hypothetical protein
MVISPWIVGMAMILIGLTGPHRQTADSAASGRLRACTEGIQLEAPYVWR